MASQTFEELVELSVDAAYDSWLQGTGRIKKARSGVPPKYDPKIRNWLKQFVVPTLRLACYGPKVSGVDFSAAESRTVAWITDGITVTPVKQQTGAAHNSVQPTIKPKEPLDREPLAREPERFDNRAAGDRWTRRGSR
jgi:hypothetical protein